MDPARVLERFLDRPVVAYVRSVLDVYGQAAGGLLANGLAFATLFATIPTALVTLGLAGRLADDPEVQAALAAAVSQAFPPLRDLIDEALLALRGGAQLTSVLGIVGIIWTVSQLYVSLDVAFARIYADEPERDAVRRTLRGFVWVALLLGTVVVAIILGSLVALADALLPGGVPEAAAVIDVLTSVPALLALGVGSLAIVYRVLPPRTPPWAAIRLPAVVVGLVVVALTQAFAFLAPRLVGVAALAGTLATAFVALAWLSFTFQALLYGAAWVRVRAERGRDGGSALPGTAAAAEPGGRGQ